MKRAHVFMLITREEMGSGYGSDVSMSQCSPGESIDTTSFGQYDRQTNLGRTFYVVYTWSPEELSRIQKCPKMEKTGKQKSTVIIKFIIDPEKVYIGIYTYI